MGYRQNAGGDKSSYRNRTHKVSQKPYLSKNQKPPPAKIVPQQNNNNNNTDDEHADAFSMPTPDSNYNSPEFHVQPNFKYGNGGNVGSLFFLLLMTTSASAYSECESALKNNQTSIRTGLPAGAIRKGVFPLYVAMEYNITKPQSSIISCNKQGPHLNTVGYIKDDPVLTYIDVVGSPPHPLAIDCTRLRDLREYIGDQSTVTKLLADTEHIWTQCGKQLEPYLKNHIFSNSYGEAALINGVGTCGELSSALERTLLADQRTQDLYQVKVRIFVGENDPRGHTYNIVFSENQIPPVTEKDTFKNIPELAMKYSEAVIIDLWTHMFLPLRLFSDPDPTNLEAAVLENLKRIPGFKAERIGPKDINAIIDLYKIPAIIIEHRLQDPCYRQAIQESAEQPVNTELYAQARWENHKIKPS